MLTEIISTIRQCSFLLKTAIHLRIDLIADVILIKMVPGQYKQNLFRWKRAGGCGRCRRDERKCRGAAVAGRPITTGGSIRHGQDQGHPGHGGEPATPEDSRAEAVSPQTSRMHPLAAAHIEGSIAQSGELRRIEKSKLEWQQNDYIFQRSRQSVLAGYKVERSRGLHQR